MSKPTKTTKLSPAILKRAKAEALFYIEGIFRVCYQDCSDSGEQCDRHENRFNGIVDDTISLPAFIEQYCMAGYVAGFKDLWERELKDSGYEADNPGCMELPIPYDQFKHLL